MSIFTEKELAVELGVSYWTIRNWRIKAGLPHFGTSGRIFYRMEAVCKWMEESERRNNSSTSERMGGLYKICRNCSGNTPKNWRVPIH